MAVHSLARATVDIDLLISVKDLDEVKRIARELGYVFDAAPMTFHGGAVEVRRVSKPDPDSGDVLMLDLLLVTPATEEAWRSRERVTWEGGEVTVVSRRGLMALKALRASGQDLDDIKRLQAEEEEG